MSLLAYNIIGRLYGNRFESMSLKGVTMMLLALGFLLLIGKLMRKEPLQFPKVKNLELEHYTFGFEETHTQIKTVSLPTKIVLFVLIVLLLFSPLKELLRIGFYDYYWTYSLP
ncbi:hypothetical protein [Psychroserpens algicola]|uniref:Uncharacterized protein n=1 Tax=Psychroserpens algicola TaxID=1719034 RepID=A0ABT0H826_9FLAO|nr:hypothetical protein [Psychroserpens algicola]MCK8480506.1 hypothetical protein [Psychroserpens algicola]